MFPNIRILKKVSGLGQGELSRWVKRKPGPNGAVLISGCLFSQSTSFQTIQGVQSESLRSKTSRVKSAPAHRTLKLSPNVHCGGAFYLVKHSKLRNIYNGVWEVRHTKYIS